MPKENRQAEAANKKKSAERKEAAIQRAIKLYESLAHQNPEKPPGYRTVCKVVEDELERETGVKIGLCYITVRARLNGMLGGLPNDGALKLLPRCSFPHSIQSGKGMVIPRGREDHT